MAANPFALPAGGFAGEGTITDPAFVFNEDFTTDDGDMLCLLSFTLDPEDGEHEPFTKFYTCGPGWEPGDGGKRAVFVDDPDNDAKNFNGGTKVGRLVAKIVKLCPDVIADRYADGDGVGSTEAAMFDGLRFNWADEVKPYRFKDATGKVVEGESNLLLPTEFLSVSGGGAKAKKAAAKKAPAAKAEETAEAKPAKKTPAKKAKAAPAKVEDDGFPTELADAAYAIYQEVDGDSAFDDWLTQVIALDGIEAHIDYVTEPEEGGLWDALTDRYEAAEARITAGGLAEAS